MAAVRAGTIDTIEDAVGRPETFLRRRAMWLRFTANKGAVVGLGIFILFILVSLFAPWLAPYDPLKQDYQAAFQSPSWQHWLGTGSFGRGMLRPGIYRNRAP